MRLNLWTFGFSDISDSSLPPPPLAFISYGHVGIDLPIVEDIGDIGLK